MWLGRTSWTPSCGTGPLKRYFVHLSSQGCRGGRGFKPSVSGGGSGHTQLVWVGFCEWKPRYCRGRGFILWCVSAGLLLHRRLPQLLCQLPNPVLHPLQKDFPHHHEGLGRNGFAITFVPKRSVQLGVGQCDTPQRSCPAAHPWIITEFQREEADLSVLLLTLPPPFWMTAFNTALRTGLKTQSLNPLCAGRSLIQLLILLKSEWEVVVLCHKIRFSKKFRMAEIIISVWCKVAT